MPPRPVPPSYDPSSDLPRWFGSRPLFFAEGGTRPSIGLTVGDLAPLRAAHPRVPLGERSGRVGLPCPGVQVVVDRLPRLVAEHRTVEGPAEQPGPVLVGAEILVGIVADVLDR